jgi:beta-glucanase (GH16 family)
MIPATAAGGSRLQTKSRFGFVYGTMSSWIKMPAQAGYWPGFWSLNGTQTGAEALTGEIDATEVYTTWSGSNSNARVWNGGTHLWSISNVLAGSDVDLSSGFHKDSVKVQPGKVTFLFDDAVVGSVSRDSAETPWAWGPDVMRPNFLILDLAVGGAGQPAPTAAGAMLVARVEVTTA